MSDSVAVKERKGFGLNWLAWFFIAFAVFAGLVFFSTLRQSSGIAAAKAAAPGEVSGWARMVEARIEASELAVSTVLGQHDGSFVKVVLTGEAAKALWVASGGDRKVYVTAVVNEAGVANSVTLAHSGP